jgi:phytoene dehydrogenase-like protein
MANNETYDAVVVGSGPNGLAAAVTIAQEGYSVLVLEAKDTIGGGTRTAELTLPGFLHDVCSAVHPLVLASPFFRSIDLNRFGLSWIHPPVPLAHPLDHENAVLLERSVDSTSDGLLQDADAYLRLFGHAVSDWENLVYDLLRPLGPPRHPFTLLYFGVRAMQSAVGLANRLFKGKRARAIFAGNSAHSILPLEHWSSAAFGLMMGILGHAVGWPIAKGGSQSIANALASCLKSLGGMIQVGRSVSSMDDIPRTRAVLFDVTPRQFARIALRRLPENYYRRLEYHRHGPGVFKIDWALDGPIPWKDPDCSRAGTVHIGGALEEIASAELDVHTGVPPEKPFVLLSQPSLFDSCRAPAGMHTAWGYCHVPNGCSVKMTDRIEAQVERFAPGFRDRILGKHVMLPSAMEEYNPNYIGGDIAGGIQGFRELFVRPMGRWRAYATPLKGVYLCSSSMPPGAGVHGMCGHLAAKMALKDVFSIGLHKESRIMSG